MIPIRPLLGATAVPAFAAAAPYHRIGPLLRLSGCTAVGIDAGIAGHANRSHPAVDGEHVGDRLERWWRGSSHLGLLPC